MWLLIIFFSVEMLLPVWFTKYHDLIKLARREMHVRCPVAGEF